MRVLVTGGAGFIGAAFVRLLIEQRPEWQVVVLDAMTYSASMARLGAALDGPNLTFIRGDICEPSDADLAIHGCSAVVNFAAETHVDRSITSGVPFARTNVMGVQVLLEAATRTGIPRFVQVSTDEVYGPLEAPIQASEEFPLNPRNTYSASKAGADLLVQAYGATHGLETIIARGCNTYGPWQYPEKVIPLWITNALLGMPLPMYGDGRQTRDWMHVRDHCAALLLLLEHGEAGCVYNIGAGEQRRNGEIARAIIGLVGGLAPPIIHIRDRPGHDRRYALNTSRIRTLGWTPSIDLQYGLRDTVEWYRQNGDWWHEIRNGAFASYFRETYEQHGGTTTEPD